jgi:SAM-dependent methyltransferase
MPDTSDALMTSAADSELKDQYDAVIARKRDRLLGDYDVSSLRGAEIGPLSRPIIKRAQSEVYYVDYCTSEELREKYAGVPEAHPHNIENVDFVWAGQPLATVLGDKAPLDYVVASHVIEHVPDLVGWLTDIQNVLKVGGRLLLIVPDKRFTFDIYRRLSSMEEVSLAFEERRRIPGLRCVMDHFANAVSADTWALWDNYKLADDLTYFHGADYLDAAYEGFQQGKYIDIHCWVFTPWSFLELMGNIVSRFGLKLELGHFLTTQDHDLEFYLQLVKTETPATDWAAASAEAFETALWPATAMPTVPADGLHRRAR